MAFEKKKLDIEIEVQGALLILKTIKTTNGNRSEAAKRMGMSREGLRKKMKRYGIAE